MKERPILFSAPMIQVLLDGGKTKTRWVMSYQPGKDTTVHVEHFNQEVVDRHVDRRKKAVTEQDMHSFGNPSTALAHAMQTHGCGLWNSGGCHELLRLRL